MIQTTRCKLVLSLFILFTSVSFSQIVTESALWEAKQIDNIYLLRIKQHVDLLEALNDFTITKDINHALIQGNGDLSKVRLLNEANNKIKEFKSSVQLTSLTGTLSLIDGVRTWDLKGTLSSGNLKAFTGSIINAKANDRVELYIYEINKKIHRTTNGMQSKATFDFTK